MAKSVTNSLTKKVIQKPDPSHHEIIYDGKPMLTETDKSGVITYVNRKYVEMSAYTKEELIGCTHNISRHPDMPRTAFKDMWSVIKSGEVWNGYVKNLRKDGKFYWVDVYIEARYDENNKHIGYIASRKPVSSITVDEVSKRYKEIICKE